jgi:hypothetical protein
MSNRLCDELVTFYLPSLFFIRTAKLALASISPENYRPVTGGSGPGGGALRKCCVVPKTVPISSPT